MISYHDALYQESHQDFLYVIATMVKDLNSWAIKCGAQFDADNNLIKESLTHGQLTSYEIRAKRLQSLLNFAVNSENLIGSLADRFTDDIQEKGALNARIVTAERELKEFKAAQCSPTCPRICNAIRQAADPTDRKERAREMHLSYVKNEMPNLFI